MSRISAPDLLGYCTNRHAGESWAEVMQNLESHIPEVSKSVFPGTPLGLSVWFSARAARELLRCENLDQLKKFQSIQGLRLFSINGFPWGDFHQGHVKEQVYLPDWTSLDRLEYTLKLISIAAELGGDDMEMSISTLPVMQGGLGTLPETSLEASARNLAVIAEQLDRVLESTGVNIHLDLEPEPFCLLETSKDVRRYFLEYLLPIGSAWLASRFGYSRATASEVILSRIRICYDVCHSAVAFEDPRGVLKAYAQHGIQVGKVQLSSALQFDCENGLTQEGKNIIELLDPFAKSRYLHQVIQRHAQGDGQTQGHEEKPARFIDLEIALREWRSRPPTGHFRVHYHVPIHLKEWGGLVTTQHSIDAILELHAESPISRLWEVETYTSDPGDVEIAKELNWI